MRQRFAILYPFAHRHWKKTLVGSVFILTGTLLTFPQPLITRFIIDKAILGRQAVLLVAPLILLVSLLACKAILDVIKRFYFARFQQDVILDIQNHIIRRALCFPKSFYDGQGTGYLMSRFSSDVHGVSWFFSETISYLIENLIRLLGGLVLLFYLEWRLAVIALGIIPALALLVRVFSVRLHALGHHGMEQHARIMGLLQEILSSMPLIKAFNSETQTASGLSSKIGTARGIALEQSTVSSIAELAINAIPGIARFAVLALGAWWIISGEWTLGSLIAFQAYLGYVFGPAQFLASANLGFQNALASVERISALLDVRPEKNLETGKKVQKLGGDIEFRNVSFSYGGLEPILRNISFHIRPGERVAIVGPSGIGKTTLLNLLLRFYKPEEGEIFYDGIPVSELELGSLRRRIGYVSQNQITLCGTIMENLRYGNTEGSEKDVIAAAKTAGIHDFIASLPDGYQALLGEKGVNFSEGQKQRLSIARALVKNPDILLLDEPSSALDSLTEKSLLESVPEFMQGKTILIAAHRVSAVRDAASDLVNEQKERDCGGQT